MSDVVPIRAGDALGIPLSHCRSCGASIFFAKTPSGRTTPVDAQEKADGFYVVVLVAPPTLEQYDAANSNHAGRRRFDTHFVTCPNAKEHRRQRHDYGAQK